MVSHLQEFAKENAFLFLEVVKRQFVAEYGLTVATAIAYGMNTEFSQVLALEMRRFSEASDLTAFQKVHGQIDELKDIMEQNIESIAARGERIELLVNQTENLRNTVSCGEAMIIVTRTIIRWTVNTMVAF